MQEIDHWREMLARNMALRNSELSQRELNFAVQQTIDRIVFLRICEDRGVEEYGALMALQNGNNVYQRLLQLFKKADEKYNSGLFHFKKEKGRENIDSLTPLLHVDDKPLKVIFKNLYYPDSPYEFSVLSADILGQVYEKFLGKVIRITPGHQAKIEEKPEVRKAGGVFYTPVYIVDYIVKATVGKLVKGKRPGPRGGVSRLKILDPACGSGSFLIGAYQFLLNWHRDEYVNDPEKWSRGKTPRIYQSQKGEWRLTTDERKRILLNNIYGVDIDHQAVEVTKLSLLLKVLEGEDEQSIGKQMKVFQERVLPDLSKNIKCGNSLIGPDYYTDRQLSMFDEEAIYRVNAFDWKTEFKEIMAAGGFDAVIGNPPYVRQEGLSDFKPYFQKHISVYHGSADLYVYFIEKGVSLLKEEGFFSYIVANKWLRANYGKPLRRWLKERHIREIIDFGALRVFQQATTYPCIMTLQKNTPTPDFRVTTMKSLNFSDLQTHVDENHYEVRRDALDESGWSLVSKPEQALLEKLRKKGVPLGEYVNGKIYYGIKTGLNKAFVIDEATRNKLVAEDPKSAEVIRPFLAGRDVKRYQSLRSPKHLILFPRGFTNEKAAEGGKPWDVILKEYSAIAWYLGPFREKAEKRYDKGDHWWELRTCDYYAEFEKPKIIVPAIVKSASYAFDTDGFYSNDKTCIIPTEDKYLLGLMGSKVVDFYMHSISSTKQGGYFEYKPMYIAKLPIRTINLEDPADAALHDKMVNLVNQMLDLNRKLAESRIPQSRQMFKRQIEATDRQIDQLAFQLYDLNNEETITIESKD